MEDSPLLARVVAELPEIFRHEILPLLVWFKVRWMRDGHRVPGRIARHGIGRH